MRALLVTIGTLGDLHPFIAVGQALHANGVAVTLAVPADHVAKVEEAGLAAEAVLPSFADICGRLSMSEAEATRRTIRDRNFVLDEVMLPSLADSLEALEQLAQYSDVVAGSLFALSAGIIAEKHNLPLVDMVLQPMTMFSIWDPPQTRDFGVMRHPPRTAIGRSWNRLFYHVLGAVLRLRHGPAIDRVRQIHGLPRAIGAPLIDRSPARVASLCCYSEVLGGMLPDFPANTHLVGFPFFDSETGADQKLDPELASFLAEGEPPIVFSLGSFAWAAAGDFYQQAIAITKELSRRAVLLTGAKTAPSREGGNLRIGYAPHSQLFPRCAAIVHHGGIGSVGQALLAGRPQLVVSFFGDQPDNAARVARLGVGHHLPSAQFTVGRAVTALRDLLDSPAVQECADIISRKVAAENGAAEAARQIIAAAGVGRID